MHQITTFRRTLLAAIISGASLMMAAPAVTAAPSAGALQVPTRMSAQALAAAQRDLAQFIAHQLSRKGAAPADFPLSVTDMQDLRRARIGYGFPVYTIAPNDLIEGRGTMRAMAKPVNQWRFVITIDQRPVGLATVEKSNGRLETVAYGAAVLAKDLDESARRYGNADKSNLRFLRIYQARSDFLEVASDDGRGRFAPLHSARESLTLHKQESVLLDESELVQPLRSAVKQNMAAY